MDVYYVCTHMWTVYACVWGNTVCTCLCFCTGKHFYHHYAPTKLTFWSVALLSLDTFQGKTIKMLACITENQASVRWRRSTFPSEFLWESHSSRNPPISTTWMCKWPWQVSYSSYSWGMVTTYKHFVIKRGKQGLGHKGLTSSLRLESIETSELKICISSPKLQHLIGKINAESTVPQARGSKIQLLSVSPHYLQ